MNCISVRSVPEILSFKDGYTLRFFNFLITGLCNSDSNYWFGIVSPLTADLSPRVTAPPKGFFSKKF